MGQQLWNQPLVISSIDGTSLTAAAAASMLPGAAKIAVPNGYWQVGKQWRIKASGRISSVIATPGTARFDLRFNTTVVWDSNAILLDTVAAHTNVGWMLDVVLTCRAAGATASLIGQGLWVSEDILGVPAVAPKGVLSAFLPWNAAPAVGATFDGTQANTVDMFFTQTAATGSMTCHMFAIDEVN